LGELLIDLGEAEHATVELRLARDALGRLGAGAGAQAAERALVRMEDETSSQATLSERELDVLRLVADGLSNTEIATRLALSVHTVHRHVANIRTKLGGESKAAIAARATRDGLI
jgi:DNA-binding NarL/FixJ family response regulator